MAKRRKEDLEALQRVLGVDLMGDVEIDVAFGDGRRRELRIRSLGTAAYDIWSADYEVQRRPTKDLQALQEVLGVDLAEADSVEVRPAGQSPLRIRSMGPQVYEIWSADEEA